MKKVIGKFKPEGAKERLSGVVQDVASNPKVARAGESLKGYADRGATFAAEGFEKTGAKQAVDRVGEKLDAVTGETILKEMRAGFEQQALYNDVLATKLQEALDRIAELEAQVKRS